MPSRPVSPSSPTRRSSDLAPGAARARDRRAYARRGRGRARRLLRLRRSCVRRGRLRRLEEPHERVPRIAERALREPRSDPARGRSEEHTSELQSPCNLVCRPAPSPLRPLHDALPISLPGQRVLATAERMLDEGVVVRGGCYGYVDRVFDEAGYGGWRSRTNVFRGSLNGPYANLDLIQPEVDRKSTRLNSSHLVISYAVPPRLPFVPYTTLFRSRSRGSACSRPPSVCSTRAWSCAAVVTATSIVCSTRPATAAGGAARTCSADR